MYYIHIHIFTFIPSFLSLPPVIYLHFRIFKITIFDLFFFTKKKKQKEIGDTEINAQASRCYLSLKIAGADAGATSRPAKAKDGKAEN